METVPYHKHTGVDSPKLDLSSFLGLETISGSSSIRGVASEEIEKDDIVCLTPDYITVNCTKATYTHSATGGASTTNYGSETILMTGLDAASWAYISLLEFDMDDLPDEDEILKVELYLRATAFQGTIETHNIERNTASWDESTVTANTLPASTNDLESTHFTTETFTPVNGDYTIVDLTQLFKKWKAENLTNYGLRISGGGTAGRYVTWASDDHGTTAYRPFLKVYRRNGYAESTIVKADASDYLTCRALLGIATEDAPAGKTLTLSRGVVNYSNLSYVGSPLYLSETPGGIVYSPAGLVRAVRLGQILSSTQSFFNFQDKDVLVEKFEDIDAQASRRIYVSNDVRYAVIYLRYDTSVDEHIRIVFPRSEIADFYGFNSTPISWGANYLEIGSAANYYIKHVYFYN